MGGASLRAGEAVALLLKDYGVEAVFGIPGVHNVEAFRGIEQTGMSLTLPRHEQGAGFMADGYARVSGKIAACFVITGPGLTNILTPLGQAYSDSVPVLTMAATLDVKDKGQARGRLHEMIDQRAAAVAVVGNAVTATSTESLPDQISASFSRMLTERPRPEVIEIPLDILGAELAEGFTARPLPSRPLPAPDGIEKAAELLSTAKDPVLILGGGAVDASDEARMLVEKFRPIVVPTIAGKGIVPDDHLLSLGARSNCDLVQDVIREADVVLAVGTELAETDHWGERELPMNGMLIRIDIDPTQFGGANPADVAILGDAKAALAQLTAKLPARADSTGAEMRVASIIQKLTAGEEPLRQKHRRVLDVIRRAVPEEAVLSTDMTQIAYAGCEIFPMQHPRRWLHPAGFGTLGYAVPAAIGAKIALPDTPVIALAGDYGIQFTLSEIAVAGEAKLPIVILVWNNRALGQIRDDMIRRQIAPAGTSVAGPEFEPLAKAFGCAYSRPDTPGALEKSIEAALKADGPTIIEINEDQF